MTIFLLHSNEIESRAISLLLKEGGFEVKSGQANLATPSMLSRHSNVLVVIDTRSLFQMKKSRIECVCSSGYAVVLLGSLPHFYWFLDFNCTSKGFISKQEEVSRLYSSIKKLYKQDNEFHYLSREVVEFLNKETHPKQEYLLNHPLKQHLTHTELKTMREISKGKRTSQIAEAWNRSPHTINNHRKNIISKLSLTGSFCLHKFCFRKRDEIQTLISLHQNKKQVAKIHRNNDR